MGKLDIVSSTTVTTEGSIGAFWDKDTVSFLLFSGLDGTHKLILTLRDGSWPPCPFTTLPVRSLIVVIELEIPDVDIVDEFNT